MAKQQLNLPQTLLDTSLACQLFCGVTANFLVIAVFYRKPSLLSIANRFIINLTIINILSCVSLLPLLIADNSFTIPPSFSPFLCSISDFLSHFVATIIPYSVLLIAVDQYFAVVDPLHYHSTITTVRSGWMITFTWAASFLISVCGLFQPTLHQQTVFNVCGLSSFDDGNTTLTYPDWELDSSWPEIAYSFAFVFAAFVFPFFLICFIYSKICAAASGNAKRTQPDMGHLPKKDSTVSWTESSRVTEHEEDWEDEDSGLHMAAPTVTLTRASPPRLPTPERACSQSASDLLSKHNVILVAETPIKSNVSLPNLKVTRIEVDTPLLKPFLPRNTSFCLPLPQRRHSNFSSDRDLLPKPPSLSKQSSFTTSRSSSYRYPVSRASSIRSTSSIFVSTLRHRLSNAGLFRYRERARAARVSALVVVMGLVCWLPFFVVYLLRVGQIFLPIPPIPRLVSLATVALILVSTIASPALFAFRNRKIRKEIVNMFKVPVNEFKTCPSGFSKKNFLLRIKQQANQLISNVKPVGVKQVAPNISCPT